ncbi:methyl-accepting chemotaxis protein [Brevibacillus sp. AG]|uniref:methyl-accepting chemotaxis protein n=1 Tax=Brevibacillus sp. AG TaxID=3020891 RepID=UPI00232DD50A|nr:methyl-accepting chemotaxis protein [Brevibacillus sp. AG]MDC0764486.1 methyl-accepting chemotaxis protein [Brevibacillus sp. AG]
MKIRTKIILAFGIILAVMFGSGTYMYVQMLAMKASYTKIIEEEELLTDLREMQFIMTGRNNDERAYLLTGDEEFRTELKEKAAKVDSLFAKMNSSLEPSHHLEEMGEAKRLYNSYLESSDKVVEALDKGLREEAISHHFGQERQARKEMDSVVSGLVEEVRNEIKVDQQELAENEGISAMIQLFFNVVGILVAIVVGGLLIRSIVAPLHRVNKQLHDIADGKGDLTQELTVFSKDEIGQLAGSFNRMLANLRELISQVREHAQQVAAAAEQLTASSKQTSQATEQIAITIQEMTEGTDRQSQNVEESQQEVEEISAGIEKIAARAQSVSAAAASTSELATEGDRTIQQSVSQMNGIGETMEHLTALVGGLGKRSEQIGQIVEVITQISGQTNLLALNAAIEAARAGEHGRGFAVVADEVRKLAEQASASAQEISQLVASIQMETNEAVLTMEKGSQEVSDGMGGVARAGEAFSQIRDAVVGVTNEIQEVSTAAHTLTESTGKVGQSMQMIATVAQSAVSHSVGVSSATEEQLASMEEIYSSAASLASLADDLEKLIGHFKV